MRPLWPTYLKLTGVAIFWAGTFVAARTISASLPPATAALLRFVVAGLVLAGTLHFSQGLGVLRQVTRPQLIGTMVMGASGILLYNLCVFYAASLMEASRTSVFVALNPVATLLLAAVFLRERISPARWLGVVMAVAGVWIVVARGDFANLSMSFGKGELAMLAAVLGWSTYTLQGRKTLRTMEAMVASLLASLWGTLFLAIIAVPEWAGITSSAFTPGVIACCIYTGVFGTAIAFVWYSQGISHIGAAKTVVFNNLVPLLGVGFGWLFLNEPLTASKLAGCVLAIAGVFLVNRTAR
ncbi:DMT family transporter [Caenimonas aquaedulcis]|uniref:DMT family transporter n=1 Tax=Caenimonas aquaedulcis TaxID=2793270 RepID=A0A931MF14_9BURK|nr:DMT family transporter [Caenimonas aquaedulcis]MBG9386764.1 DMT family transporter [Caenimonas aquaedulcis]